MSINAPLLKQTLAKIEAEPEHWYQGWWVHDIPISPNVCDTAYCFAGHAVILHGAELVSVKEYDDDDMPDVFVKAPPGEPQAQYRELDLKDVDGHALPSIDAYARHVLGLNTGQGLSLFDSENDLLTLRRIVGELCELAESEAS